jgi:delta(3,5)-delta(2,4)-dienoyl-CoA isomerase
MQDCFTALERCPIPIIAAIHGSCIGAGMDLISAADIRVCTSDAQFSVREVVMGLAADVGTLQRLPRIVGNQSVVRDLCYTGRNMGAMEAYQIGLVSHVVNGSSNDDILKKAIAIGTTIALHSPVAVQNTKKSLIYSRDHTVEEGLEHIAMINALCLQGDDTSIAWAARASQEATPAYPAMAPHSRL